jgi:hypothetical protein
VLWLKYRERKTRSWFKGISVLPAYRVKIRSK